MYGQHDSIAIESIRTLTDPGPLWNMLQARADSGEGVEAESAEWMMRWRRSGNTGF